MVGWSPDHTRARHNNLRYKTTVRSSLLKRPKASGCAERRPTALGSTYPCGLTADETGCDEQGSYVRCRSTVIAPVSVHRGKTSSSQLSKKASMSHWIRVSLHERRLDDVDNTDVHSSCPYICQPLTVCPCSYLPVQRTGIQVGHLFGRASRREEYSTCGGLATVSQGELDTRELRLNHCLTLVRFGPPSRQRMGLPSS